MPKVTSSRAGKKAGEFPLFEHRNGQWAKKRLGKLFYFGKASNGKEAAMREYRATWDYILEHGVKPSVQVSQPTPEPEAEPEQLTVKQLCNLFLNDKQQLVQSGEISPRTWVDYKQTCDRLLKSFSKSRPVADLRPDDFQKLRTSIARDRGPVALGNEVQRVRTVFKFGYENGHLPKPMLFGQSFRKPKKKVIRGTRNEKRLNHGKRMLDAAEFRTAYAAATMPLQVMMLLAINGGLGQSDLGSLKLAHLDLEGGWLNYPRPKTGIDRRIPLWPETVAAIREWLPMNPKAKLPEDAGLLFITKYGGRWSKVYDLVTEKQPDGTDRIIGGGSANDTIGKEFTKVLQATGIKPKGERVGLSFYAIRHSFETIGGETADQVAVDGIMGHVDPSMGAAYREGVADERLRKVTDYVRSWLWPDTAE